MIVVVELRTDEIHPIPTVAVVSVHSQGAYSREQSTAPVRVDGLAPQGVVLPLSSTSGTGASRRLILRCHKLLPVRSTPAVLSDAKRRQSSGPRTSNVSRSPEYLKGAVFWRGYKALDVRLSGRLFHQPEESCIADRSDKTLSTESDRAKLAIGRPMLAGRIGRSALAEHPQTQPVP